MASGLLPLDTPGVAAAALAELGKGLGPGAIAQGRRASRKGLGLTVVWTRINGETPQGVLAGPLVLPVTLGSFQVTEAASHVEYDTIAAGQFSTPGGGDPGRARQLRSADVQTLTLDWDAPWLANTDDVADIKAELYRVMRSRRPFKMVATIQGRGDELRMNATLRSISRELRPGEADTRYYDLEIKEWRDASVGRKSSANVGRKGGQGGQTDLPAKHKLTADDTFNSLSKDYYGSTQFARDIASANGVSGWGMTTPIIQSQRFKVGDSIKIPKKPTLDDIAWATGVGQTAVRSGLG